MTPDPQDRPMGALLTDALQHLSSLMRGEVRLARAEIEASLRTATAGIGLLLAAVVLAVTALNVLSAALVAALVAKGMPAAWAALVVGSGFAAAALLLALAGAKTLRPTGLAPTRFMRSLRRDAETFKEIVTNDPSS